MRLRKVVFLVDMDGTLLDTSSIKSHFIKLLGSNFTKEYEISKKKFGYFNVKDLSEHIDVDRELFYKIPFKKYLFPKSLLFLKKLKKNGKVIIFTKGEYSYQKQKFQNSEIQNIVGKNNLIIVKDKISKLKKILPKLRLKYSTIALIDDRYDVLKSANLLDPKILTIWIRQDNKNHIKVAGNDIINFSFATPSDSIEFIDGFVKTLPQKYFKYKLSVVKGLKRNYIDQLIEQSTNDREIQRFTHDKNRFSNEKSINAWLKGKRYIYILTNVDQKLLGIIWFTQKKFRQSNWTFAIRLYKPARGKGLAMSFMKVAFNDFDPQKKTHVWLSTDLKNKHAESLYRKFGFVRKDVINGRVFMINDL